VSKMKSFEERESEKLKALQKASPRQKQLPQYATVTWDGLAETREALHKSVHLSKNR